MEMKQLEIFVCVARNLSFSKAAEELYISQPGVSSHVSSLEKNLGVQLLVRNTKGVSLTKAGTDFMVYAQRMLALREQAVHDLGGANKNAAGTIDIISSTIPVQHLLPEIISSFQKQWPNILFRVEQVSSCGVKRALGGFRYDFGIVGTTPNNDDGYSRRLIYNDELVLVFPNDTEQKSDFIKDNFVKNKRFKTRRTVIFSPKTTH
jgi:DNA-binding transcriptional LysR family regulator